MLYCDVACTERPDADCMLKVFVWIDDGMARSKKAVRADFAREWKAIVHLFILIAK